MSKRKETFKTTVLSKPGHQHSERLKSSSKRQHASRADSIHIKRACLMETNATACLDDVSLWLRAKQQSLSNGDKSLLEDVTQLQSLIAASATPLVLFECLKLATNMALGDLETVTALQPLLLNTLQSLTHSPECNQFFIKRQLSWLIGNMALSSDSCLDALAPHVMPWLLHTITESNPRSESELQQESLPQVHRSLFAWALCNMLRGQSVFVLEQICQQQYSLITTIVVALDREYAYQSTFDLEMCEELLWCCVYLTARDDESILLACYNSGLVSVIHQCFSVLSHSSSVLLPAFRVLGNLCLNKAMTTEIVVNSAPTLALLSSIVSGQVEEGLSFTDSLRKEAWRLLGSAVNVITNDEVSSSLQLLLQGVFSSDDAFVQLATVALSSGASSLQYSVLQIVVRIFPTVDLTAIDCFPNLITGICRGIHEAHISDFELLELAILSLLQATDRRPQLLSLLTDLDIAEVVENVQYTSSNAELSRLAGTLVELIYSEMDRADD